MGIGLNRFLSGHRHKIQADVFDIETRLGEETLDQLRVRLQWQVKF